MRLLRNRDMSENDNSGGADRMTMGLKSNTLCEAFKKNEVKKAEI